MREWGYLRETTADAKKAGVDHATGLHRTGLNEYLATIFPNIKDWVHNKEVGKVLEGKKLRTRPDYRSESRMLIVEFDGVQHYSKPDVIRKDVVNTNNYRRLGYKVVRIPYFIQLTNDVVKQLFNVDVEDPLFDGQYASLGATRGSPAYLCPAGLERIAAEFTKFPQQYSVNLKALKDCNDDIMTGASLLEAAYNRCLKGDA